MHAAGLERDGFAWGGIGVAAVWYGGAVGAIGFDGDMNTGLTLRTIRIKDGVAEVRAGATLLYDSDPDEEEAERKPESPGDCSFCKKAITDEEYLAGDDGLLQDTVDSVCRD